VRPRRPSRPRQDRVGDRPERLLPGCRLRIDRRLKHAAQHTRHVGIDECSARLVGERRHGARGVGADPGQSTQRIRRRREATATRPALGHLACEAMQIARARIVAKSFPRLAHTCRRRSRNGSQRGERAQELCVLRDDARDLGLLEHQLRHEDPIRIAGASPGQVAGAALVPGAQPATEIESLLPRQLD
jgi:hypothetical protein